MAQLLDYLKQAVEDNASDLFIATGSPVCEKRDTRLIPIRKEKLLPQAAEVLITELYTQAGRPMERYLRNGDDDFSFSVEGLARFRVNTYRQRGSMASVMRVVAFGIPDWKAMHIPSQVMELAELTHGMAPAYEIMHVNSAVRSLIRDSKACQLNNAIAAGGGEGMIIMDQSIQALYAAGEITIETALEYPDNPDQLCRRMGI